MRSVRRGQHTSDVEVTNVSSHGMWVLLGERELFLSFEMFPWFRDAPVAKLLRLELPHEQRPMALEIVGEITQIETIAAGASIRELPRLRRLYGRGRWRKMKGIALVRLRSGTIRRAELHWYEAQALCRQDLVSHVVVRRSGS